MTISNKQLRGWAESPDPNLSPGALDTVAGRAMTEIRHIARELLAARAVVQAARRVKATEDMTLLSRYHEDMDHELGASKAFNQCARIVAESLAAYDAACNPKEGG